ADTFSRLQSVPGMGKILALVLRYAIHDIDRLPRVQDCVSYCRLVQCAKASAGTRYGPSGPKMGHPSLTRAVSGAAVLCLRAHPVGQQYRARWEKKHGQGKAFTVRAHTLARAVDDRFKRRTACEMPTFLNQECAERVSPTPHWTHLGCAWGERSAMTT